MSLRILSQHAQAHGGTVIDDEMKPILDPAFPEASVPHAIKDPPCLSMHRLMVVL